MSNNTLVEPAKKAKAPDKKKSELDEYELSAQHISILFSQFKKYGYALATRKKKAPIRVLESFIFEGLHDTDLFGTEEKEMLALCKQAMYHKNKIVEYMLKRKKEKENNDEQSKEV